VGRKSEDANRLLEEKYVEGMNLTDSIKLAIESVRIASGEQISSQNIKVAVVASETKSFKRLSQLDVEKYYT
jgi:20S proteasome alpha/beta subunit